MIFAGDGICSENYFPPKNARCEYQTWISAEKELDWGEAVMSAKAIGMTPLPRAQRRVRRWLRSVGRWPQIHGQAAGGHFLG